MDIKLRKYALFSFFQALILGFLFAWLFSWKAVGISFPIYTGVYILFIFLTVLLVEGKEFFKRVNGWFLLTILGYLTSLVFVYRCSHDAMLFAFISLPFFYIFTLIGMLNNKVYANFGFLTFISTPIILFLSWFVDIFKFASNLKFETSFSPKAKNLGNRVFVGIILAVPFLLLLFLLLFSADSVFANIVTRFWNNTVLIWFKDVQTLMSTISRMVIALFVAILTMVFNFALFNKESFLHSLVNKTEWMKMEIWKKNWDVVVSSTFMFLINVLFLFFMFVQLTYLFGGEKNINGLNLSLSYAEYARRGFAELIIVASIVSVIAFVLNYKVFVKGLWQALIYRANHIFMIFSVLVISYSANSRLMLYESAYGYTNMRIFVHIVILVITLLYISLYVSLLFKKSEQFVNRFLALLIILIYFVLVLVPFDTVSSYLNYQRYLKTEKIDFIYLFNQSSEVIPVMRKLVDDQKVKPEVRELVLANAKARYEKDIYGKRLQWQSYNWLSNRMDRYFPRQMFDENLTGVVNNRMLSLIEDYALLLESGDYDFAFTSYWSSVTKKIDRGSFGVKIFDYSPNMKTSTFESWIYRPDLKYITVEVDVKYSIDRSARNAYFPKYSTSTETLYLRNYDGQWKIIDSTLLKLGGVESEVEEFKGWKHISDYSFQALPN